MSTAIDHLATGPHPRPVDFDASLRRRAAWAPVEVPPSFRRDDTRKALGFFLLAYAVAPLVGGIVAGVVLGILQVRDVSNGVYDVGAAARLGTWVRFPVELLVSYAILRLVDAASHALPRWLRGASLVIVALTAGSTLANASGLAAGWVAPPWSSTLAAVLGAAMMTACALILRALLARRRRRTAAVIAALVAGAHALFAIAAPLLVGLAALFPVAASIVPGARLLVGAALWITTSVLAWRLRGAIPTVRRPSPEAFE